MKQGTIYRWLGLGVLAAAMSGFARLPDSVFSYRDTNFRPMWNGQNLDADFWEHSTNWSVMYPGTDTVTLTASGARTGANGWTNLVWANNAEYSTTDSLDQSNFEIRFRFRLTAATSNGNSGFNIRGYCRNNATTFAAHCGGVSTNWLIWGPQIDLGTQYSWDIWNSAGNRYVGSSAQATPPNVNNTAACRTSGHQAVWNSMGMRVINDTMWTLKFDSVFTPASEIICAKFKITNPSEVAATTPGAFALQYESANIGPEYRNIRIKNLRAVAGPVALRPSNRSVMSALRAERGAVTFSVPAKGAFSVKVIDVRGKPVASFQGVGPVAQQRMALNRSGVFMVRMFSAEGVASQKVFVP